MLPGGVRKLSGVAVLVCGLGAVWTVAPALSTDPYVPRAIDFEQPLRGLVKRMDGAGERLGARAAAQTHGRVGSAGHDGERAGSDLNVDGHGAEARFQTGPIRAPRRFDLVGVAGEIGALEFRTRRDGEAWSRWVETVDGNPVWAGGADLVQVRGESKFSGRLHYVNVTGSDTPLRRLLTGVRSAVSSAVSSVVGTEEAEAARALRYVSRAAWGADRAQGGCPPRTTPSTGKVKLAAIHHTVTTNNYESELGPSVVLGICRYHRNANGWNDIGYNALVDRYGTLYEGRAGGLSKAVIGAHAAGWNSLSAGVALIGTHISERPQRRAVATLVKFLAWKLKNHGWTKAKGRRRIRSLGGSVNNHPRGSRPRLHRVLSHRHLNPTSCAGDATEKRLKKIRQRIQNKLDRWDGSGPAIVPSDGTSTPPASPTEPPTEPGESPEHGGTPPGGGSSGGTPTGGTAAR